MDLKILNPLDCPSWEEQLLEQNEPSVFYTSNWAKVLKSTYGYSPAYCAAEEGGMYSALLPVMEVRSVLTGCRGVSIPFTDYCEMSLDGNIFRMLINRVVEYGRKSGWSYLELRGGQEHFSQAPVFDSFYRHTLMLWGDKRRMLAGFRNSTVRNIRKAEESGVETKICTSLESVQIYYRLHCLTRKRLGVPPQPFQFFRNIHEFIVSKNKGFVVIASFDNQPVAGAIYFHFGQEAIYKYGASDYAYQHLRANNLVMWEAIKWFSLHGYRSFSFGRTNVTDEGLRQFKNGWGTMETVLNYYKINVADGEFVSGSIGDGVHCEKLFRCLSPRILSLIGRLFYRHMG